jgi:glutamyl-tRNA synthetase
MSKVRVRFAPSPTGGLHLGGVRTVLYNYLFARQHNGTFILRIEDTDQSRYVEGAEDYIYKALSWCRIEPDESPRHGGNFGPYRQSERKDLYRAYAERLVQQGHAYYAFDTPAELDAMRTDLRTEENPTPQYDHTVRMKMRNSLSLKPKEVNELLKETPHVIRIKMPEGESVSFTDMIRGEVTFDTSLVDDKVLLKADGMPTYHLAVVVDDHLMEITHAFRGEEWLPSAPVHILLWRYLFGEEKMPQWAHLPLILGPSGKLSKRDAMKYGFPVFAMNWNDPKTNELTEGFKERGFLPEAFINMLAMLGWNDGSQQEIFTLNELVEKFTIDHIHKGGAKFDFEKAKWFNHEWIKKIPVENYLQDVKNDLGRRGLVVENNIKLDKVLNLVKERCTLLTDFYEHSWFFFDAPGELDTAAVLPKWNEPKAAFFREWKKELSSITEWNSAFIENAFKQLAAVCSIKPGELQLPFRIMLVGGKFGPGVFDIAEILGPEETIKRIDFALTQIK